MDRPRKLWGTYPKLLLNPSPVRASTSSSSDSLKPACSNAYERYSSSVKNSSPWLRYNSSSSKAEACLYAPPQLAMVMVRPSTEIHAADVEKKVGKERFMGGGSS
jgi:hypothetical protein